jgi:hypothetical protein
MIYELRSYTIHPGKREYWVKLMEAEILPYQTSKGMVIIGTFLSMEDPDLFIWIRSFRNQEERETLQKSVIESEYWINSIRPKIKELLVSHEVKLLESAIK